jgi:hypothetical protein
MKAKNTDTPEYKRFLTLLESILCRETGDDQTNLNLHEIWKDRLWEQAFQSLRDFAVFVHIPLSQFYTRINRAEIHQQMSANGIVSTSPRGREVDLLVKLPPQHRVEAWLKVTEEIKNDRRTHTLIQNEIREFAERLK